MKTKVGTIYTCGYGLHRSPEDIARMVVEAGSRDCVYFDIRRSRAHSRNPHWRGDAASRTVLWEPALGNLGGGTTWVREIHDAIWSLALVESKLVQGRDVCLVCAETDPKSCHRAHPTGPAAALAQRTGAKVVHL